MCRNEQVLNTFVLGCYRYQQCVVLFIICLVVFFCFVVVLCVCFYILSHVAISGAFVLTVCAHCLTFQLSAVVHITLNSTCFFRAALPSCANNK